MKYLTPAKEAAIKILLGLDAARRASSPERPVDEVALIEAAILDLLDKLKLEADQRAQWAAAIESEGRRGRLREKKRRAIEMHKCGLSYREIATQLGYQSTSGVYRMVNGEPQGKAKSKGADQ